MWANKDASTASLSAPCEQEFRNILRLKIGNFARMASIPGGKFVILTDNFYSINTAMTQLGRSKNMQHSKNRRNSKANASRAIINLVIRLEKRVWQVAQRRDAEAFAQLVPHDAVMIFQSGITSQPEYLATMQERTISGYKLRNIHGFMPNAQTVILHYEALRLGEEAGTLFPEGLVIESTTWVKRKGRWVAVLNQETPIRSPKKRRSS